MECFYCNQKIRGDIYMAYDHQFCCDYHRKIFITSKDSKKNAEDYSDIGYDLSKSLDDDKYLNIKINKDNQKMIIEESVITKYNFICIPLLNRFLSKIFN